MPFGEYGMQDCNTQSPTTKEVKDMYWIDDNRNVDLRRNTLSIRFTDAEHRLVCDAAWRSRISASAMIRGILLNGLQENGLTANSGHHCGAAEGLAGNRQRKQSNPGKPFDTAAEKGG
jgi:hypothetical protein